MTRACLLRWVDGRQQRGVGVAGRDAGDEEGGDEKAEDL